MTPILTRAQADMVLADIEDREKLIDCYHFAQDHLPPDLSRKHMEIRYPNLKKETPYGNQDQSQHR